MAQKVVGELREKIAKSELADDIIESGGNSLRQEALSALTALGFDRGKSAKAINEIIKSSNPSSVEELIKQGLKQL